jgi:hypothetical protein
MAITIIMSMALQLVSFAAPDTLPALWVFLWDDSTSQKSAMFVSLPDFCRDAVLPMMRPGDTVVLVRAAHAPSRPGPEPETRPLDPRPRRFGSDIVQLDAALRGVPQFKGPNFTDIGRAFDYLRRVADLDRQAGTKRRFVLVGLTDGRPDGPQTGVAAAGGALSGVDYRIVMLGIDAGTEDALTALAATQGFADTSRLLFVPHAHVTNQVDAVRRFVGAGRAVNADVVARLKRASIAD